MRFSRRSLLKVFTLTCFLIFALFSLFYTKEPTFIQQNRFDHAIDDFQLDNEFEFEDETKKLSNLKAKEIYEIVETEVRSPGENGAAYELNNVEVSEVDAQILRDYGINQAVSNAIPLNRVLPDFRNSRCRGLAYSKDLPSVSVIYVVSTEAWSTLLRSLHSVINRTPSRLLTEIILVLDANVMDGFEDKLKAEVTQSFYASKVNILRNVQQLGLIQSRNFGAKSAIGDVLMFMEANSEVGSNWLVPLLQPIKDDRVTLAVPLVNKINWNDFSVHNMNKKQKKGIFDWTLSYQEYVLSENEGIFEPYVSSTFSGEFFAIEKNWFERLGMFDSELKSESNGNLELSFKVWQCGGRVLWVPCSQIARIVADENCLRCRQDDESTIPVKLHNSARIAEVWFDEAQKEYFHTLNPQVSNLKIRYFIRETLQIKLQLQCKSFSWYLENVAQDILERYPVQPANEYWGILKNRKEKICLSDVTDSDGRMIEGKTCQLARLNKKGQLTVNNKCVTYITRAEKEASGLYLKDCVETILSDHWSFNNKTYHLQYKDKFLYVDPQLKVLLIDYERRNDGFLWIFKDFKPLWAPKYIIKNGRA